MRRETVQFVTVRFTNHRVETGMSDRSTASFFVDKPLKPNVMFMKPCIGKYK
ncbi:hypothetical protein HY772_04070 [Candidatus Woesearchaeota archaeon]|nr:hypothetical protein [Candidatus Woesearchaeota archaeon]